MTTIELTFDEHMVKRITDLAEAQDITIEQLVERAVDNLESTLKDDNVTQNDDEDPWGDLIQEVYRMRDEDYSR